MSNDAEWVSVLKNYVARKRMSYNFVLFLGMVTNDYLLCAQGWLS